MSERVAHASETGGRLATLRTGLRPPLVRRLAWLAIAGQVVFVASWIVAGALEPGYSNLDEGVSILGGRDAAHPWILNTGLVVLGLAIAALGPCVLAVLPRRRASTAAAVLFVLAGLLMAAIAALPLDCNLNQTACEARLDAGALSWRTYAHLWVSLAFDLAFVATAFFLARALWPGPVAAASAACGLFGVAFLAASFAAGSTGVPGGLVQRLGFLTIHLWVVFVAVGVLHSLRQRGEGGVLVPVRPRDFFGRAWHGRGEVTLEPAFLWRRLFPLPVDFRREAEPLGEDSWTFTDTTRFANGFEVVRRMVCVMEAPDRVKVIAEDMPGGAELVLTEGGYRVRPYRYTYPVGPIGFTMSCHDRVVELGDGSLDWTIAFRWHGLPIGRIAGRVRPV